MIEVRQLSKRYGQHLVVDGLDFDVRPGRVTGFLGPNGAGKSTTMRMMLGLDRPSAGSVSINGRPYARWRRPLHEVGAVLEVRAMHGGRSAYNHLLCLAQSNGLPSRRVHEVLELVGLESVARRRTKGFSLGMSQRLGIAAAMLGDPPVLLLDEPVNGLDPEGIVWVRQFLRARAAEGRTVLLSSHLMSEMALTADHLIVIAQGRLVVEASTAEVIRRSGLDHVLVRSPQAGRLHRLLAEAGGTVRDGDDPAELHVSGLTSAAIGDIAAAHRVTVHELGPRQASLEAAFLELTRDRLDFRAHPAGEVA
ncbi:MAG TPA: ATP-binding cassette domain-containing protein [Jatrophihabitans sp.]|jgi:ABC-2 type transport system ATP-binding protein|uniref:ABC transporter ATP-binding protein n=1 Tax=Jatrophihabitans sp. TaxID=1932789 RepID=UPI002E0B0597|nr:ATP-binding cassette domain-containing protein [Jatrophihabitans sp.]